MHTRRLRMEFLSWLVHAGDSKARLISTGLENADLNRIYLMSLPFLSFA
jgi:hypothetical protein